MNREHGGNIGKSVLHMLSGSLFRRYVWVGVDGNCEPYGWVYLQKPKLHLYSDVEATINNFTTYGTRKLNIYQTG